MISLHRRCQKFAKWGAASLLMLLISPSASAQAEAPTLRDSLKLATEALSFHPDSVDLRLRKAALNVALGEWEYAKKEYDAVLDRYPRNIAALFYRAYVNQQLHRYNFARVDYENLLTIIPTNFEARLGLALLNQKDKHHTAAMDGINDLVAAYPDSALAWAARAGIEVEQGMDESAEYDYTEALRLDPDNSEYLLSRADIRIRLRRFAQARADLDAIVKLGTPRAALKEWFDRCR
jgi:tetratricopeptide (TPR) repeat protein